MTTTPHDALVRSIFTVPENAISLLSTNLPKQIVDSLVLSSLSVVHGTFVDAHLTYRHTDILFAINLKESDESAFIYVLFEHQFAQDHFIAFRMLEYMVRIWAEVHRKHPNEKRLPLIIPVLFYHRKGMWTAELSFAPLVNVPPGISAEAQRFIPDYQILFHDVGRDDSDTLRKRAENAVTRLTYLFLRFLGDNEVEQLLKSLASWGNEFNDIFTSPDGQNAILSLLIYLTETAYFTVEEAKKIITPALKPKNKEKLMNFVEELELRGREAGIKIGKLENARAHVLKVLKHRNIVVSEEQQASISECKDLNQLELWLDLAITCKTANELFSEEKSPS